jgi:pimeloyl-ACP methyl ester carboxylesterase
VPDQVILLHGLWMRGFALAMLDKRLIDAGFDVRRFDYLSIAASQEHILDQLRAQMRELGDQERTVHLVGHSLGGLLAMRACSEAAVLPPGRIVCLGSPLLGSSAARGLAAWGHAGEALLGHNRDLLQRGFERWKGERDVGVIAGRLPLGLGTMLGHLEGEHDGTVAVAETQLPGIADHCVVESNHMGLLFSAEVARCTADFLHTGRFPSPSS